MQGVHLEEPVNVMFGSFHKQYFVDVLIDSGIFEFKAAESLAGRHQAQLLNYLLLCNLGHGKLINVRAEGVEHEFVNTEWQIADRLKFRINSSRWDCDLPNASALQDYVISMLRDIGTGLECALYEEAITHFLGGDDVVLNNVIIRFETHHAGMQRMRLMCPGVALKVTTLNRQLSNFETHARKLLDHLDLKATAWININVNELTLATLTK